MISEKEYKAAVHEYTKNVFRFLHRSLNDKEACNDIVQDCFLKLWQNRKNVDPKKIKPWLFAVAHNAMINFLKVASRTSPMTSDNGGNHVFQHHDFDTRSIIDKVLNQLPALQKSILLLRDLEGYEYKEIAEILEINETQVKVYLFRARLKVKNTIKSIMNVI
jgi:RNA polymerase sigma-70 factor (ECF subfamily)